MMRKWLRKKAFSRWLSSLSCVYFVVEWLFFDFSFFYVIRQFFLCMILSRHSSGSACVERQKYSDFFIVFINHCMRLFYVIFLTRSQFLSQNSMTFFVLSVGFISFSISLRVIFHFTKIFSFRFFSLSLFSSALWRHSRIWHIANRFNARFRDRRGWQ